MTIPNYNFPFPEPPWPERDDMMTPMDKNPRHFTITVSSVDVKLNREGPNDTITILFAGRLLPSTKDRIVAALDRKDFAITEQRLA